MILCVMMAATGAIGIKNMRYEFLGDLVPLYIIALAALWFCYEVNTIRPCPPITGLYKRNFGFFYNALGKALFIIFMGLLCFGVEAGSLGVITGLAVAIDGGLLILLFLKYPHMYPKDYIRTPRPAPTTPRAASGARRSCGVGPPDRFRPAADRLAAPRRTRTPRRPR